MTAAQRVERARGAAGLSQRALADATGLAQATLSRIERGEREAKVPELLLIAAATGCAPTELLGGSTVEKRAECAARGTGGSDMEEMRQQVLRYLELDAYLVEYGIRVSAP